MSVSKRAVVPLARNNAACVTIREYFYRHAILLEVHALFATFSKSPSRALGFSHFQDYVSARVDKKEN